MQKVYLLLRSNQQTGPYNLEELLQFDLKPFDLIWIEGRSAGWYYPQEIPALQPHLSFLKQIPATSAPAPVQESFEKPVQSMAPKSIFVSMPSNPIKEESTPKPSFSSQPQYHPQTTTPPSSPTPKAEPESLKTTYAKSLDEVETEYMNWAYQKKTSKKKTVSTKGVLVACLIAGIAFVGWALLQPADENPGKTPPEQTAFLPEQNELSADGAKETESIQSASKPSNKKQKLNKLAVAREKQNTVVVKEKGLLMPKEETVAMNDPQQSEYETASQTTEEKEPAAEEKTSEQVTAETPKEKKKLRDKIADLFRKKPDEKKEEARPAEEEGGERRSVRRESGSNLAKMVTVKFTVPNDWMMGIKGAKATLTNRGSEAIVKAVVEVVYYNDDNDILDKRTVTFGNIKSRQTQTMAVPDHQTATRLEYNVVSVTGANEPFAKK